VKRLGVLCFYAESERLPWFMGFVDRYELGYRCAPVPLNVVAAWWLWLLRGMRWGLVKPTDRWLNRRRAIHQAFERGRMVGYNQGKSAGFIAGDAHAREAIGRFAEEYLARAAVGRKARAGAEHQPSSGRGARRATRTR